MIERKVGDKMIQFEMSIGRCLQALALSFLRVSKTTVGEKSIQTTRMYRLIELI